MDPSKTSARQTHIIDDLDAIGISQGQRKAPSKKKKQRGGTGASTSQNGGSTKSEKVQKHKATKPEHEKNTKGPKKATKPALWRFYKKNGLTIPLLEKNGKKKAYARLSNSLSNKNTDYLLDTVEAYAGKEMRREFVKSARNKAEIADWIEAKETIALGRNPRSTLKLSKADLDAMFEAELDTFSDDDLTEEDPGVKDADAPRENAKTEYVKAKEKGKSKATKQSQVQDNGMLNSALCFSNEVELTIALSGKALYVGDKEALRVDAKPKGVKGRGKGKGKATMHTQVQGRGKRKRDNAPEPAHDSQQTTKKLKTRHVEEHLVEQSRVEHIDTDTHAKDSPRKIRIKKPMEMLQEKEEIPTISVEKTDKEFRKTRQEEQQQFINEISMHPDNPDASTMVVRFPELGVARVLTASTNAATGKPILHDTPIFRRQQTHGHEAQSAKQPFLKEGTHGRHDDFQDDPNRRTGRGHQLNPEDQTALEEYMQYRGLVLQSYPRFPDAEEGDEGYEGYSEIKQGWDENEMWYNRFTGRFPGFSVNHLWPCGCEKLRGESEDEESEEE